MYSDQFHWNLRDFCFFFWRPIFCTRLPCSVSACYLRRPTHTSHSSWHTLRTADSCTMLDSPPSGQRFSPRSLFQTGNIYVPKQTKSINDNHDTRGVTAQNGVYAPPPPLLRSFLSHYHHFLPLNFHPCP